LWSQETIIKDILDSIDEVTNEHKHLQIEIIWVPGHAEIKGNEHAAAEAKRAAKDPTRSQTLQATKVTQRQAQHCTMKSKIETLRQKSHNYGQAIAD
jgi:ribonuclease HI